MPASSDTRSRHVLLLLVALALLSGFIGPDHVAAAPATPEIRKARAQADEARRHLDELAADLEERTEDYLEIEDELSKTRGRISETERELSLALADLDRAELRLSERAAAIYRNGTTDYVAVFVGATDFKDFISRVDLMRRIGNSDASIVSSVKDTRVRIETSRSTLERRREEQILLRNRARIAQTEMQSAIAEQKTYLDRLDGRLKKLIVQEKARQERLARERAAAEAARRAATTFTGRAGRSFDPDALGESHPRVVELARRYVGKVWYVWGGTTPAGFDCSGLVLYCYRELGIYLPRTSRQQYLVGAYIPPDRLDLLLPGDLVFFGREGDPSRVHHVAIYSGDGRMIHAPQSGEKVSETSLLGRIASRGDYVGAVRP